LKPVPGAHFNGNQPQYAPLRQLHTPDLNSPRGGASPTHAKDQKFLSQPHQQQNLAYPQLPPYQVQQQPPLYPPVLSPYTPSQTPSNFQSIPHQNGDEDHENQIEGH